MNPEDKEVSRFYCYLKVHEPHEYKKASPERPIISQSGSICETIGAYVEPHIRHIATKHGSYLEDTPDFLREIVKINNGSKLESNTVLVTMDAVGLFTNIIHEDGMEEMEIKLNEREKKNIPTEFIMKLMNIILYQNIFEFHDSLWMQNIGAAMGSKPIPPYANIFMAKIDRMIKTLKGAEQIKIMKIFLDDYFKIFQGSTKELHSLLERINNIHPTIKLTMSHTTIQNEPKEENVIVQNSQKFNFWMSCVALLKAASSHPFPAQLLNTGGQWAARTAICGKFSENPPSQNTGDRKI